ncbi:hypothetical protein D3C86_1314680 [compost metagenome]
MGELGRPRRAEVIVGHQVDAFHARRDHPLDIGRQQRRHGRACGNADPDAGQALLEFTHQRLEVARVLGAVRVAGARVARILPVQVDLGEHRKTLDDERQAVDQRLALGRVRRHRVKCLAHRPAAQTERQLQVGVLVLQLLQAAEHALGLALDEEILVVIADPTGEPHVQERGHIAPGINEGGFVQLLAEIDRSVVDHVLLLALVADDSGEADDDLVVGGRVHQHHVQAAPGRCIVEVALEATVVLRPVREIPEHLPALRHGPVGVVDALDHARRRVRIVLGLRGRIELVLLVSALRGTYRLRLGGIARVAVVHQRTAGAPALQCLPAALETRQWRFRRRLLIGSPIPISRGCESGPPLLARVAVVRYFCHDYLSLQN